MATKPAAKPPVQTPQEAPQTALPAVVAAVPFAAYGTGSGTVVPAAFAAELAAEAKDAAAVERPSIGRISLRAGIISYEGNPVKDNILPCVILAMVYENSYYSEAFDANNIVSPDCFALLEEQVDGVMRPHANVLQPMNETCLGCPKAEWGSDVDAAGRPKKGKACKERRRLVLLPVSALASAADVKKAELALLSVPVMSVKNYGAFVNLLAGTAKVPPYAVISHILTKPDPKSQFQVHFEPQSVITDGSILTAIREKREEAIRVGLTPFDPKAPADADDVEPTAPAKKQKF